MANLLARTISRAPSWCSLKLILLLGLPRSRPRAGGGWAGCWMTPLPSREGVGDGWGSTAAEAVSRLPGPPLEDPPTSPPHPGWGRSWGERGGTTGARAASQRRRRSVVAGVTARLAPRLQRSRPNTHEQRRPCGRRATKGAHRATEWCGGRDAASQHLQRTEPSDLKGATAVPAGSAGLTVLRQGWKPVRGETPVPRRLDAQRDSPAGRSRATNRWFGGPTSLRSPSSTWMTASGKQDQLVMWRLPTRMRHSLTWSRRPEAAGRAPSLSRTGGPTAEGTRRREILSTDYPSTSRCQLPPAGQRGSPSTAWGQVGIRRDRGRSRRPWLLQRERAPPCRGSRSHRQPAQPVARRP